ncbi:MAG: beta-lactamase family protein [Ignavibacteriales bacterium]|nr:beta-lactamase family protein [Ignavibacteriales bacterium]
MHRSNPGYTIKNYFFSIITAFTFLLYGCSDNATEPNTNSNEELKKELQTLLDSTVSSDNAIHNAVLLVDAPDINFKWKGASGIANPQTQLKMEPNDQFRIASLGKMTLAVLTMKLIEEDRFKLDDFIFHYLPGSIMNRLHIFQGKDYSNQITIRQLLNHTSGLPDYIEDGNRDAKGATDFMNLLKSEPNKFWKPEETIEYTKQNLPPHFAPGNGFHYGDTNYQLLGLILQNITGKKLNILYREKLFTPLGMNHTYMEYYDDPMPSIAGRNLSHVYFDADNYTDWISNSADWAGGGIISTTEDLNRFMRAFVNNEIFRSPQTKQLMLNWQNESEAGLYYGFGIVRINFSEFGLTEIGEIYGHDGFPQSFMFYVPKQNVTIAGTLNQAVSENNFMELVLTVISLLAASDQH